MQGKSSRFYRDFGKAAGKWFTKITTDSLQNKTTCSPFLIFIIRDRLNAFYLLFIFYHCGHKANLLFIFYHCGHKANKNWLWIGNSAFVLWMVLHSDEKWMIFNLYNFNQIGIWIDSGAY